MKKLKYFFYSLALLLLYSQLINPAYAQEGVNIGEQFLFGEKGISEIFPNLGTLVNILLPNVYVLAGIFLFFLLVFGGFGIIMGIRGGNPEQTAKGGKAVVAALGGFLIIFLSYWIIKIIEVITGIDIFQSGL